MTTMIKNAALFMISATFLLIASTSFAEQFGCTKHILVNGSTRTLTAGCGLTIEARNADEALSICAFTRVCCEKYPPSQGRVLELTIAASSAPRVNLARYECPTPDVLRY